ncbi:MAG: hypothetical protein ACD_73C00175G0003 [uncultured bacterium]|nr:MAG: hypothetical protein ACD_73C00175G0003 [uncultured bacterium]
MSHFLIRKSCNEVEAYVTAQKAAKTAEYDLYSLDHNAVDLLGKADIQALPKAEKEALLQSYYDVSESLDQQSHFAFQIMLESDCFWPGEIYVGDSRGTDTPEYNKFLTQWRKYQNDKPPSIWERTYTPISDKLDGLKGSKAGDN